MYATTKEFLDYFNLRRIDELPPLSELKDLDSIAKEAGLPGAELPDAETDAASEGDEQELLSPEIGENVEQQESGNVTLH